MTRTMQSLAIALGAAIAIGGGAIAGCGGDDTEVGGTDGGGRDATGLLDQVAPDAPVSTDGATNDAKPPTDGGGNDAKPPTDGGADALPPPPPDVLGFYKAATTAFCTALRDCCLVSAAKWKEAACESDFSPPTSEGYAAMWHYFSELTPNDAGIPFDKVVYDQAAAQRCLADFANIPQKQDGGDSLCGVFPTDYYNKIKQDCFGALAGEIPSDGGPPPVLVDGGTAGNGVCTSSTECAPGGYCDKSVPDAGACKPIKAVGTACSGLRSEDCTYLGLGTPGDFCDPANGNTCQPGLSNDAGCAADWYCQSELCLGKCASQGIFSDPGVPQGVCAFYTSP